MSWSGVLQIALLSTPNPSKKISEFFAHFPPIGTILSQIGSDIKEFHGFIDVVEGTTGQQGKVFDKYKSSYAVCSDVIMVASMFVGVGELVAISKGAKVSTVIRASVKSTIIAPGKALKDIVSLTTKTMSKIDGIALVILEKMVENNTLVKFLQFDGAKAYLMNKQLNKAILEFDGSQIKYFKVGEATPAARRIFEVEDVLDEAGEVVDVEILEGEDGSLFARAFLIGDLDDLVRRLMAKLDDKSLEVQLRKDLANEAFRKALEGNEELVRSWGKVSNIQDILKTNPKFLNNISDFSASRIDELNTDLANIKWKDELTELFNESPDDVKNIWHELKERPDYHFEIKSSEGFAQESRWEKWSQREFFKESTKKGIAYETMLLEQMATRKGAAYDRLSEFVKDLDKRKLLSQVQFCLPGISPPCNNKGEYFIADQIWVKFDEFGDIEDMVIVDSKLSKGTNYSSGQTAAKNHIGGTLSYKIESSSTVDVNNVALSTSLKRGTEIKVNSFYKAYGDGDKSFSNIE